MKINSSQKVTHAIKKIKNSIEYSKERVTRMGKKNVRLCLSEGLAFDLSLERCGASSAEKQEKTF